MIRKTYVGVLMMCLLVGCQSVVPRSTESLEVKQMRINGADFAYIEEGKGVTVVVIHGAKSTDAHPRKCASLLPPHG